MQIRYLAVAKKKALHRPSMLKSALQPDDARDLRSVDRWWDLGLTSIFAAVFLVNLAHHQMWRDELNVWGIVRASPTLESLAYNIHYEGHPGLWYYLLWFPSKLSAHPSTMKLVEALIGIGICWIVGMCSPWTRLEKALVLSSYYVAFEYTVLSRTYGLCLLIALGYVYLRGKRPQAIVGCAVLLGLLANTDIIGVILSLSLLLEYAWCIRKQAKTREGNKSLQQIAKLCAIYGVFLLASYVTLRPAKDISWVTTGKVGASMRDMHRLLVSILSNLGLPWFPFSLHFPHKFWNPNVLLHPAVFEVISVLVLVALVVIFRERVSLLAVVAASVLGSILFAHLVYLGYMRHFGLVFVAFLLAYWLKRLDDPRVSRIALTLLAINALGGIEAIAGSWFHPFSNAQNAAKWLVQNHLQDRRLVGFPDFSTVGVAVQLMRPIYFAQCNCTDTFMQFSSRRDDTSDAHLTGRLLRVDRDLHTNNYILILDVPLSKGQEDDLHSDQQNVRLLKAFTDAEEAHENFYLYEVKRSS